MNMDGPQLPTGEIATQLGLLSQRAENLTIAVKEARERFNGACKPSATGSDNNHPCERSPQSELANTIESASDEIATAIDELKDLTQSCDL